MFPFAFESSVKSYDIQTKGAYRAVKRKFESSVKSYDIQTDAWLQGGTD